MSDKVGIWMPLYIGDYLADTMHLTTEQHGAYLLLIMAYWKNGRALPSNDQQLAAICRMPIDAWSNAKAVLADFFDTTEDGKWINHRVEKEISGAGEKKQKARDKAVNAANKRWGNDSSNAPSIPQAMHEDMLGPCPSPSPSPIKIKSSSNQDKPDNAKAAPVPFQKIMAAYCEALPTLPQPQAMTEKRKTAVRGIWRDFPKSHADDFWSRYFGYVAKSEFLMGMHGIGIDWLINKANFFKVIEGNYHHA